MYTQRLKMTQSRRSAHVSQALLIRGVHQSPTKSIARVLSNFSGESTTPCSSIRSITARWDRALYQYQPESIGASDVQWVDFTLACYAVRHLYSIVSSSVTPQWLTTPTLTVHLKLAHYPKLPTPNPPVLHQPAALRCRVR